MSKVWKLAVGVVLAFSLLIQPVSAAAKTIKIKVTLVSVELVDNDHVGNEWYTTASVNGKTIEEGSTLTLTVKPTDTLKLKAYAEEQDKIPDKGTTNATLKVSNVKKSVNKELNVKVVENRGRYSGNEADWKFTFKIEK
ncbi:hypothetical protein J19TS2_33890 [Cohnella xylanilytica]|uniref:YtkA-like protein n=1 Tax=Cohnella xylanilytica TaxID=557555 RepID=A0A841UAM9_9BACL|nr:hypothetical protein [Cohnella xylanilytica]MBB6695021.1 hypothetical protein [Cohnella xylanilytica]GIO13834.1 hypothetical protein J19TS2_33890 [Cohnella xylanilytica]